MEHQDQGRVHAPGQDSHGVHLCHKCGWPFPNPHPSAKHRRAHKKVCGKMEGYKLVESEDSSHLTLSDDEHLSDEDHRSPSPKIVGTTNSEKVSDGVGEKSRRSGDELFSDAVSEFSEGGQGAGVYEREVDLKVPENNVEFNTENETARGQIPTPDLIQSQRTLAYDIQMHNPEVPLGKVHQSQSERETEPDVQNVNAIPVTGNVESSLVNEQCSEAGPGKPNIEQASSVVNENLYAFSLPGDLEVVDNPEALIKGVKDRKEFSLENEHGVGDHSEMPQTDGTPGAESFSDEAGKVDTPEQEIQIHCPASAKSASEQEGNDDFYVLSMPGDLEVVDNPEALIKGFRDQKEFSLENEHGISAHSAMSQTDATPEVESFSDEAGKLDASEQEIQIHGPAIAESVSEQEGNDNFYVLSMPGDLEVVDNPEALIKGFKDQKEKLHQASPRQDFIEEIQDRQADIKHDISGESHSTFLPKQLNVEREASDLNQEGESGEPSEKVVVKEDVVLSQLSLTLEEVAAPKISAAQSKTLHHQDQKQDDCGISAAKKQESIETFKDSSQTNYWKDETKGFSDVDIVGAPLGNQFNEANGEAAEDVDNKEKTLATGRDVTPSDSIEGAASNYSEERVEPLEFASNLSESQIDMTISVHEGDNADDHDKDKFDLSDISAIENREEENLPVNAGGSGGCEKENPPIRASPTLESIESDVRCEPLAEDMKDGASGALETENVDGTSSLNRSDINLVPCTEKNVAEGEIIGGTPVQAAGVGVTIDAQLHDGGDIDSGQKTSGDQKKSELKPEPAAVGSSNQSSATVEVSHAKDSIKVTSESSRDETEDEVVKRQLIASVLDASVDSSSQTDSLEGNWGSVSVLSTLSDVPATEAEVQPPAVSHPPEAEKANLTKLEAPSTGKIPEKSLLSDPPSSMVTIESRAPQQATVPSERLRSVKPEEPRPASLHVPNDSVGRKKSEAVLEKVTNWNTEKAHTPLKSLLGEAALETKPRPQNPKENPSPVVQNDQKVEDEKGSVAATVNSILGPESPAAQTGKKEIGKEWDSPARYPSDIKREKRKGRPYWMPFMCCSSVKLQNS